MIKLTQLASIWQQFEAEIAGLTEKEIQYLDRYAASGSAEGVGGWQFVFNSEPMGGLVPDATVVGGGGLPALAERGLIAIHEPI